MEIKGVEPLTSCLQGRRSSQLSYIPIYECTFKIAHWKINNKPFATICFVLICQTYQKISQYITCILLQITNYFFNNLLDKPLSFSLERRWSSRTFRYGYLVTTSPQSLILPSTAASFNSWLTGFGYPQLSWCDGRCVQGPGTYSRQYADLPLLAIPASCRRISAYNQNWGCFLGFAQYHYFASLCNIHCSTCVAQDIKGMMIWRHPHLPPYYLRQSP